MKKGFTLIELLIVMVLVGVLVTIALPKYRLSLERGRAQEGFTFLRQVAENLNAYYIIHGEYPSTSGSPSKMSQYLTGKNASDYVRQRFFDEPIASVIGSSGGVIQVKLPRSGFYQLSALLERGELVAFRCSKGNGDAQEYEEYCQTLGFVKTGNRYLLTTGGNTNNINSDFKD